MSDRKEGLKAALAELGAGAAPAVAEGQDGLFPDPATPLSLPPSSALAPGKRTRGRGRRTQEWVDYILSRYRSPLIGLAEIAARPVRQLAEELELYARSPVTGLLIYDLDGQPVLRGDAILEAAKLQKSALEALAPYLHSKQPQAIEVQSKQRGLLVIGDLGAVMAQSDGLSLPLATREENQRVIDVTPDQSDAPSSDARANPLRPNDNA